MRVAVASLLLLTGCANSGYWRYLQDTATLPGANPNKATGSSETYQAVRHGQATLEPPQLLTEGGDVWPGPPKPVPTLRDLQKQQAAEVGSGGIPGGLATGGLAPLPPLPSLPGFEIAQPEPTAPPPEPVFPKESVVPPAGSSLNFGGPQSYRSVPGATGRQSIIVPNGNGTSTVIGPNGEVTTIPTPK